MEMKNVGNSKFMQNRRKAATFALKALFLPLAAKLVSCDEEPAAPAIKTYKKEKVLLGLGEEATIGGIRVVGLGVSLLAQGKEMRKVAGIELQYGKKEEWQKKFKMENMGEGEVREIRKFKRDVEVRCVQIFHPDNISGRRAEFEIKYDV